MKSRSYPVVCMAAAFLFGVTAVSAAHQDRVAVQNHIRTGDVNIGIEEYEAGENTENVYDTSVKRIVLPSQKISKIPRITNYAEPCYVRVHISFHENQEEKYGLSMEDLSGMPARWVKAGDYYYLTEPLEKGESAEVFRSVTIPSWWDGEMSGASLGITVQAEAVQAAGMFPDFTSEDPWNGIEAEFCVHEQDGTIQEIRKQYQTMYVVYEGAAGELVAVPEDFFSNLDAAMPGEELSDAVELRNTTDTAAEFFFRTEVPWDVSEVEEELLKKFRMVIGQGDRILYSGDLRSEELTQKEISLGILEPGEESTLYFALSLPADLKNSYARRESCVNWIFSVRESEEKTGTGSVLKRIPETGDRSAKAAVPILLFTVSAGFLWVWKRKERKNET